MLSILPRAQAAVALVAVVAVIAPPASAAGHLLVPAYFAPEGSPNPWHTMCASAASGSTAILNPRNGPVKRQAGPYLEAMSYCRERGWRTIGYVFTKYGKRSLKAVEKAIAHYFQWYPTVEGIFLDEMAERPSSKVEAYYGALQAYVHEKGGALVGNPGNTASTPWQLAYVDLLVTFEGTASDFTTYAPPAWIKEANPDRIANIVFNVQGSAALEQACAKAAEGGAWSVYVTDLPESPNPYATLPSYWSTEAEHC